MYDLRAVKTLWQLWRVRRLLNFGPGVSELYIVCRVGGTFGPAAENSVDADPETFHFNLLAAAWREVGAKTTQERLMGPATHTHVNYRDIHSFIHNSWLVQRMEYLLHINTYLLLYI